MNIRQALIPLAALLLLIGAAIFLLRGLGEDAPPPQVADVGAPRGCITDTGSVGGPIELTDMTGARVTQADYAGRPAILYFGFTHCPDICPNALDLLGQTLDSMGDEAAAIQPILVTVDPPRDTPEQLAAYVTTDRFPDNLIGLTGTIAEADAASLAFAAGGRRIGDPESPGYVVDHNTFFYMMDSAWRLRGMIRSNETTPDDLAQCIRATLGEELRRSEPLP